MLPSRFDKKVQTPSNDFFFSPPTKDRYDPFSDHLGIGYVSLKSEKAEKTLSKFTIVLLFEMSRSVYVKISSLELLGIPINNQLKIRVD